MHTMVIGVRFALPLEQEREDVLVGDYYWLV